MKYTIEQIARICHEMNRRWCQLTGDNSQPAWEDAPEWQRISAVNGVKFHIDNPNAEPSASHDSWLEEKSRDGWVWGPIKDPELKQHPCIVPYNQLPPEQRAKDAFFLTCVGALLGD